MSSKKKVEDILEDFKANAARYAYDNIRNEKLRSAYIDNTKRMSEEVLEDAKTRVADSPGQAQDIWKEASERASKMRNDYLNMTRKNINVKAEAFSKMLKEEGLTYPKLLQKYAGEGRDFAALSEEEQVAVLQKIVEASGRTNKTINVLSKVFGKLGYAFVIITIGIEIWRVVESQNPVRTAVEDAVTLGFGLGGSIIGEELGAAIGACGGPVGVFIGAILGGIVGGFVASFATQNIFDAIYNAFLPASMPGPGPPKILGYHDIYGVPYVSVPPVGPPHVPGGSTGAPDVSPPDTTPPGTYGLPPI